MESSASTSSGHLHWTWAETNNAILSFPCDTTKDGDLADEKILAHAQTLSAWRTYYQLLKTIEGIPGNVQSLPFELVIRHNAAVVLLHVERLDEVATQSRNIPRNAGFHLAFHILHTGLLRVSTILDRGSNTDDKQKQGVTRKHALAKSLSLETVNAVAGSDVASVLAASAALADRAMSADAESEESHHVLVSLLLSFAMTAFCLQELAYGTACCQLLRLCVDIVVKAHAYTVQTTPKDTDKPDLGVAGFSVFSQGLGVKSFWCSRGCIADVGSAVFTLLCAHPDSHVTTVSDLDVIYQQLGNADQWPDRAVFVFLKAWYYCRDGRTQDCLSLLQGRGTSDNPIPWGTMQRQVDLLRGVCYFLLGDKTQEALLNFRSCVTDHHASTSASAMAMSALVLRRLNKFKAEVQSWKLAIELLSEAHDVCCDKVSQGRVLHIPACSESPNAAVSSSGAVNAGVQSALPALTVHHQLYSINLHLRIPQRTDLLYSYAKSLLAQGTVATTPKDAMVWSECSAAYSSLVTLLVEGSTFSACQVFDKGAEPYANVLLEFADALRSAARPADSIAICSKLLQSCAVRPGSPSAKLGVRFVNGSLVFTGATCMSLQAHSATGAGHARTSGTSRKRKHNATEVVDSERLGLLEMRVLFLESAAWYCLSAGHSAMKDCDRALDSLQCCTTLLDELPSLDEYKDVPGHLLLQSKLLELYSLKGQAMFTKAQLLPGLQFSDHDSGDIIKECLQAAIDCCTIMVA